MKYLIIAGAALLLSACDSGVHSPSLNEQMSAPQTVLNYQWDAGVKACASHGGLASVHVANLWATAPLDAYCFDHVIIRNVQTGDATDCGGRPDCWEVP